MQEILEIQGLDKIIPKIASKNPNIKFKLIEMAPQEIYY